MRNGIRPVVPLLIAGLAAAALWAMPAAAQVTTANRHQGPLYDNSNDTYYELRVDNRTLVAGRYTHFFWSDAKHRAAKSTYKNRRGRLAVIRDQQTLDFIRRKFEIREEAWIGLRFYCRFRKLMWVTGEIHPLSAKAFWDRHWNRQDGVDCRTNPQIGYMGVYLTPSDKGAYWQAVGSGKGFWGYFVEYPPPHKKHPAQHDARKDAGKSAGAEPGKPKAADTN